MNNPFQMNDWESKKFLRMIVAIHIAMLGAIGLDFIGLEIPIIRQLIGFAYLTFIPGIVIIRLLGLHKIGFTETILFSSGLSISFLMFSGFLLNSLLSFFKINSPLSFWNVVIFITALVTILSIISCRINKSYIYELQPLKISRSALYLMLLPALSIIGTYSVNFQKNNIFLLILILFIALVPILVAFNKIPSKLYPLAIVVIALSLLFHRSLISMYLTGWDINNEYYFHKLVINNSYWNPEIWGNVNAMLSIVILPAVYSYFLKMDGAWVFKVVYPIIFSFVPLGLYCIYKDQLKNEKIAFFSVFFFMSFNTFFTEMLSLARQEIAELFFVLLIFLFVKDNIEKNIRNILLLIFGASLVTSHYALSYLFIVFITFIYLFSSDIVRTLKVKGLILPEFNLKKLTLHYFVAFYIILSLLWYINFSSSSVFKNIVTIGDHIYTSIFTDFLNPESMDRNVLMAFGIVDPINPSLGKEVHRGLQYIIQFFIIIGFFKLIIYREFAKLKAEYFYLMVASLILLLLSVLPFFSTSLNMTRIYHIALLALSPLFMVGGLFFIEKSINIINRNNKLQKNNIILILVLTILIPYYLFNTGFIYEATRDIPTSMSLGMERMKDYDISKKVFYNTYIPEQDVFGATWYYNNKDINKDLYADYDSKHYVLFSYGMTPSINSNLLNDEKLLNISKVPHNNYIYLRKFNVCENSLVISGRIDDILIILPLTSNSAKIYSNGCGEIYNK